MEIFNSWNSDKKYNKCKILEDNYIDILNEIPIFDIDKIIINKQLDEYKENLVTFLDTSIKKTEWIYAWHPENKWFNFPLHLRTFKTPIF